MAPECLENRGLCETFWETRLRRHLSRENARQIAENVTAFFAILAEWSRANVGGAAASSPGSPNELQATDSDYGAGEGAVVTDLLVQLKDVCRSGDGRTARCPAHPDRHNSLSVHHRDGSWLLKCHAGYGWQEIINALGIDFSALFDDEDRGRGDPKRERGEEITRNAMRRRIAPKPQFHRTILAGIGRDEPDDGIPFN